MKSASAQQSPEAAELQLLKQQVAELMKERQEDKERISAMESQVKAMGAQVALSASIAKSKTLAGPDGKEISLEGGPVVIPPIETFTRNLKYHWYARPGIGFTGNGVGQTASFQVPGIGHGRFRLGNENDNYFEFGFIGTNLLGDPNPDVIDAKFRFTLAGVNAVDKSSYVGLANKGFDWATRNAYVEFKNVIKSAPEVAFWAGQRYYDTYDIHSQDYGYLDNSGYGGGAYDINVGVGKLAVAYFAGIRAGTGNFLRNDFKEFNLQVNGGQGNFYVHLLDIRLGEIAFLGGKLKLVLNGAYMQGGNFTITTDTEDDEDGQGHVDNSGGAGGGFVYQYDLPKSWGPGSFIQLAALYGWGLVNFSGGEPQMGKLGDAYNSALVADNNAEFGTFEDVNPFNNSQRAKANAQFVWNPTDNFSLNVWTTYQFEDQGFTSYQDNNGSISSASGDAHLFTFGIRPVYWIWGPFAIQGQAGYSYISNVRSGSAFGEGGSLGIFTIAPTIKPRGGFFTRPELRIYATFATWSDSLRGAVGGSYYSNNTYGWNFGIQAETWF
ncbi:MAG TPA: carbohydrate porin [Terrimicrobiaceae bacterium]